jgi:hypothetical protein
MWKITLFLLFAPCFINAQSFWNTIPPITYASNWIEDFIVSNDTMVIYGTSIYSPTNLTQGLVVAQIDSNGNVLREVFVADSLGDKLSVSDQWGKIIKTSDGGYIATTAPLQRNSHILIKFTFDLEIAFIKEYEDTTLISNFWYTPIEVSGGYLLYGVVQHPNLKIVGIVKFINYSGDVLWEKQYSFTTYNNTITDLKPYADSTFIMITSESVNPSSNPWLNEYRYGIHILDYQGNILKQHHSPSLGYIRKVIPIENGDFITYGLERKDIYFNTELLQPIMTRFDSNFNVKWSYNFGKIQSIGAKQLQRFDKTIDGHFVGVGQYVAKTGSDISRSHGWIYKFSAEGDSIWGRTFPTPLLPDEYPNGGILYGVGTLSSGNIVAGGTAEDALNRYCLIIKITNDGCMDTLFCQTSPVVQSNINDEKITISPNPASDFVLIASPDEITQVSLVHADGRIVYSYIGGGKTSKFYVPVEINNGLYIVQLMTSTGNVFSKKLIINK